MKVLGLVTLMLSLSCAHEGPRSRTAAERSDRPLTFMRLKHEPLAVNLIDRSSLFTREPQTTLAAQNAVESQLKTAGVTVTPEARRVLIIDITDENGPDKTTLPYCLRVEARVGSVGQQFLPTQTVSAVKCGSNPVTPGGDMTAALWALGAVAVREANGTPGKERAAALFDALASMLIQLDARSSE